MIALYMFLVSGLFLALYEWAPSFANQFIGLVVLLILLPAIPYELRWWRGRRRA